MRDLDSYLQLHLEPAEPIEVWELTAALDALARQYRKFAASDETLVKPTEAKLLVSSIRPGSIDISLFPDLSLAAGIIVPVVEASGHVVKFAKHIRAILDYFSGEKAKISDGVSVKDCEDVAAITRPTAEHGGKQIVQVIKDSVVYQPVYNLDQHSARQLFGAAGREKRSLLAPMAERKEGVSLTWSRLDRQTAKISGKTSPDKATIFEIDPEPHAVLFTSDMAYLKKEMIEDEANPMQKVYFVDVEVSRAGDGVAAYRIVGYHGKDDLSVPPPA